jgi:hypothetical protein
MDPQATLILIRSLDPGMDRAEAVFNLRSWINRGGFEPEWESPDERKSILDCEQSISLVDDGTLDTVVECATCGRTIRFSGVERDESGEIADHEWYGLAWKHESECGME